tara:strand:+ start:3500 stop:4648 length:1149 start_codon:yes stop_codon:yes gene_type:complete
MKLLLENWRKLLKEEEEQYYIAYHCGRPDIEAEFDLDFLGSGEGTHILGPGIYFATNKDIAERYCKYREGAAMYKAEIPKKGIYNPTTGEPRDLRDSITSIVEDIEKKTGRDPYRGVLSLAHGKGSIGAIVKHYGPKKARELIIEAGIIGAIEEISAGKEIALFDLSAARIVPVQERPSKVQVSREDDKTVFKIDGGRLVILENSKLAGGAHSVLRFFVDEDKRGQGLGKKLIQAVLDEYPGEEISAQVSSLASLKAFMSMGFAPSEKPEASFGEAKEIFDYNSGSLNVRINDPVEKEGRLQEKCQKGYKTHPTRKTKIMFGKRYRNCVKAEGSRTVKADPKMKRYLKDRPYMEPDGMQEDKDSKVKKVPKKKIIRLRRSKK